MASTKAILDPQADLAGNAVSVNWWGTLFWWDNAAHRMANAGYQVILSSPDFLYLDHPYEADPDERGYYWGTRATSIRKLFSYISGNLPANAQLTRDQMGNDYAKVFARTPGSPRPIEPLARPRNVIGLEGSLWSETVRTRQQLEEMIFPRLLALAERAWHRARWEPADGADATARIDRRALDADWERFANLLGHKELPKLDRARVHYRLEVPGARIVDGALQVNLALPGLPLEYRNPAGSWTPYDPAHPPTLASTLVRSIARDRRPGRAIPVVSRAPTPVAEGPPPPPPARPRPHPRRPEPRDEGLVRRTHRRGSSWPGLRLQEDGAGGTGAWRPRRAHRMGPSCTRISGCETAIQSGSRSGTDRAAGVGDGRQRQRSG